MARLEDLLSGRLFESLREKQPNVLNKVAAIIGDITEPGLGISPQDEALLEEEVFYHSYFHSPSQKRYRTMCQVRVQFAGNEIFSMNLVIRNKFE